MATVPVSGSVKYKGQPVDHALVSFATEKSPRTAVGMTDAKGEFKLTTINTNDGAIVGDHVITIVKAPPPGAMQSKMESPQDYTKFMQQQGGKNTKPPGPGAGDNSIPGKYGNPTSSGLKRTVVAGESNVFNFDLTD